MGNAAAFFDLDRTLLVEASGRVLGRAMQRAGVVPNRSLPGESLIYRSFNLFGESLPGMALARSAALAVRGRSRDAMLAAAEDAAEDLVQLVAPYAPELIAEHHSAGRTVVLATTTPYDLIEPFARRMGMDDIVATRYATKDGRYTGGLDGDFVWAAGKLRSVRKWADSHQVELSESWAYSDSVYDLPLLMAVGHPNAVNADPRLAAVAALRRWPQPRLDAPPGVPKVLGVEPFDVVRTVIRPEMFPYARFDIAGTEHLPKHGAAIVIANHRSYFDTFALALAVMRGGRNPRGLAKRELFDAPVIGQLGRMLGAIMVDREGHGADAFAEAIKALRAGEVIALMPQGTIPRGRDFFQPELHGKTGAARMAAATHAPVIPVGIWGSERVWPRSSRLPNVTNVLRPPTVRIRIGPPVEGLSYSNAKEDTKAMMAAIVDLLPPEAKQAQQPSEDELARTKPPT
jgi:putative phosphoserine phosphatase/1-acylglycerol-3-phosphate O-acyltransferase